MTTLSSEMTHEVCERFGLGDVSVAITSIAGSSSRLHRLDTSTGCFVLKELSDLEPARLEGLIQASEFELSIAREGRVLVPEPVSATDGQMVIELLHGSRGRPVIARLHRWLDGVNISAPSDVGSATVAGRILAEIQRAGTAFSVETDGSLRWWSADPDVVVDRLVKGRRLSAEEADRAKRSIADGLELITAGEALPGRWVFSHSDHKPENSLRVDTKIAVLDWDVSGHNHPRLEAVESALRWAGCVQGPPRREVFSAFLHAYDEASSGAIGTLAPADFAKWVSALVGWFVQMGRRALRDFDQTEHEANEALRAALQTIERLDATLANLDRWTHPV
jgi:Ser/Thr protein kinase RdoA (MazF antagonist)